MANRLISRENVIVAQLKNDDDFKIRNEDDVTIIEESDDSLPIEVIKILKFICKNFANYILVDNQFIQIIRNEIRKARVERGRRNLAKDIDEIAPYFKEDPELTVFSVLDGEDLNGLE
ncbi:MAG: hypothetical protein ACLQG5_04035 [Methanobacterium sp.]